MEQDRGKVKQIIGLICGILAAVLLVGGFAFSSWYKLEEVQVMGSSRYTKEEIKEMTLHGIAAENTFLASHLLSRENITDIPFVDSISVTALDRNTIAISVHEKKAVGCFPWLDNYIYFDRNGIFIEGERVRDESVPYFSGIRVKDLVQNQKLDIRGTGVLNTAVVLSTIFQKNTFLPDDILFDENYQVSLRYGDIEVELGSDANLEEKMTRVLAILPKVSGRKGILHAETVNQNSKTITFELEIDPENWDGGYDSSGEYTGEGLYNQEGLYVGPKPKSGGVTETVDEATGQKITVNEQFQVGIDYLDADGDGYNDFTGDPITEDSLEDLSYLDEDGDGYNDWTGALMPGVTLPEESGEDGDGWEDEDTYDDYDEDDYDTYDYDEDEDDWEDYDDGYWYD